MWKTLIQISPKDLVVPTRANPKRTLLCFIVEDSCLTGQRNMRSVACVMFSTHQEWEKLSHGSSLVLRPCSQILGWGKFMAVKESAHCFKLSSLEFLYCSTLSCTLETLGFKTKRVITGTIFCASQAVQLGCLSYHQSNCARGGRGEAHER